MSNQANVAEADNIIRKELTIINKRGLHARASARFVQLVSAYDATVEVEKDGTSVGGTSIMGLMMLAASPGCSISVTVRGKQAVALMTALEELVASRFGEEA